MKKVMQSNVKMDVSNKVNEQSIDAREQVINNLSSSSENFTKEEMINNLFKKSFDSVVVEEVNKMEKQEGRELTEAEVQAIVDEAIKENYHIIQRRVKEYIEQIKKELEEEKKAVNSINIEQKEVTKEEVTPPAPPKEETLTDMFKAKFDAEREQKEEPKVEEKKILHPIQQKLKKQLSEPQTSDVKGILEDDKVIETSSVAPVGGYQDKTEEVEVDGVIQKVVIEKAVNPDEGKLVQNGATLVEDKNGNKIIINKDGDRYDITKNKLIVFKCLAEKLINMNKCKEYGIM